MITVAAAIIEKNETFLIARKRAGLHLAGYWEFPGGKLEENETPEKCLQRELLEEFGIQCRVEEFAGESIYDYGTKKIRLLGYKVRHLGNNFTLSDHDAIRWLPMDDLVNSLSSLAWAPADIPLVQAVASRQFHEQTIAFYNSNAAEYIKGTIANDMQLIRRKFTRMLPAGGHILDLGCGSGRDTKAFLAEGFQVTAMDASPTIAAITSKHLGRQVLVKNAQDLDANNTYHGIWACASLLHLPGWELPVVLKKLEKALLPQGVLYMSFKEPSDHRNSQRFFCYPKLSELRKMIDNCDTLQFIESFTTACSTADNQMESWLNIFATQRA